MKCDYVFVHASDKEDLKVENRSGLAAKAKNLHQFSALNN